MHLEVVISKGLSHNSYYLSAEKEAVVVDPRRDCKIYKELAESDCTKIKYILETHRNEDYVIGSIELQKLTNAEIGHSKETDFEYGQHKLQPQDTLQIGNLKIKTLHTPGHTNDSLCYVVYTTQNQNKPILVFTGDTLFSGDVGRTDLLGKNNQHEQSKKLFDSLHNKILPLGKHVQVYPAHGGGSVCGHNISDRQNTTIGYELATNPLLKMNKEEFVEILIQQNLKKPPYFNKMEILNLKGPPLIKKSTSNFYMNIKEFEKTSESEKTIIVDVREVGAFAACHIPGSINIWLGGMTFFPGWILTYDQQILLISESKDNIEVAKRYLWRLGFDQIVGYLCPGIKGWRNSGKEIENFGTFSAIDLKKKIENTDINVVDVRSTKEWKDGHIKGSTNIYVGELKDNLASLEKTKPVAVLCSVGDRGGIGASILKKAGFTKVFNVLGGLTAWKNLGYPLEK